MATVSYHLISELACHHYWSMTASYQEQSWTNNLAAPTDVILHQLSHEMTEHDKKKTWYSTHFQGKKRKLPN